MIQNGGNFVLGTSTNPSILMIGYAGTGLGTFTLDGADTRLTDNGRIYVGAAAVGIRIGGVLTQAGGTFNQNNGTVIAAELDVAQGLGSTGIYNMAGGALNANAAVGA